MIGKTEEQIFFPAKARQPAAAGRRPAPADEKGDYLSEQTLARKDGNLHFLPAEYVRTAIRENDKTVGAVVMFKDITERKLAADRLSTHQAAELARSNARGTGAVRLRRLA